MPDSSTNDEVVAAGISRGALELLRGYTGCGPTKARTVIAKDTVAIILSDTLTAGERTFVAMGERDHVLHTRQQLQQVMRDEYVRLVEVECDRHVEAFMSDDHIDPDCAVEFFLLEPLSGGKTNDGSASVNGQGD